jgi:hypothetical protein
MSEGTSKGVIIGVVVIAIIVVIGGVFAYQSYFQPDDDVNAPPPPPENKLPKAIITTNWTSDTRVGDPIEFNATKSYDDDGYIILYTWEFHPGGKISGSDFDVINKTFATAGTYTVNLTVRDNDGGNNYAHKEFTIRQADVSFGGSGAISTNDLLPLDSNATFTFQTQSNALSVNFSLTFAGGSGDIDQNLNSRVEIQVYDPMFRLMDNRSVTVRGVTNQTFEYTSYQLPLTGTYQIEVMCEFGTVQIQYEGVVFY